MKKILNKLTIVWSVEKNYRLLIIINMKDKFNKWCSLKQKLHFENLTKKLKTLWF